MSESMNPHCLSLVVTNRALFPESMSDQTRLDAMSVSSRTPLEGNAARVSSIMSHVWVVPPGSR